MTAREVSAAIGTHVLLEPVRGLRIECLVTNAKNAYGHSRIEIEPIRGEGRAWVNAATVRPAQKPEGR